MRRSGDAVRRRTVLAALLSAGTAGCLGRVRSLTGWQEPTTVSIRIKTLPADADPYALRIARMVAGWYRNAGIDAQVVPMARQELLREVLLNEAFDVIVLRAPARFRRPDALYALLHSQFAATPGWQNPFGFANLEVDARLDEQRRRDGESRRSAVADLQRRVARTHPFTIVGFPDEIRATRDDRYGNLGRIDPRSPLEYLTLQRAGATATEADTLRVVTTDSRPTENLNPFAVEFRRVGDVLDLVYDPLGRDVDGTEVVPWLADSWVFSEEQDGPTARVRLREGVAWHDGEAVTAEDVAFTHTFLADTSGESGDDAVPSPRFRGRNSLVADVRAVDSRVVEFEFVECDPQVATRAFTVPVLPRHVWSERTDPASVGGIEVGGATEALVTNNLPPVGSGPLAFVRNTPRESLVLERFDEHVLFREDATIEGMSTIEQPGFDRLAIQAVGSDVTAVDVVAEGDADVTGTPVGADRVAQIGRASDLGLSIHGSDAFYIVGYNARRSPFTNPRLRNALGRLIDQRHVIDEIFDGYARPAASPLAGTGWVPNDVEWGGTDPATPFLGTEGELDLDRVRDAFRAVGYRYEGDQLVEG